MPPKPPGVSSSGTTSTSPATEPIPVIIPVSTEPTTVPIPFMGFLPTPQKNAAPQEAKPPEKLELIGDEETSVKTELTGIQKAGVGILTGVGCAGTLFIVLIFCVSFGWEKQPSVPTAPAPPAENTEQEVEKYTKAINAYGRAIDAYNRSVTLYKEIQTAQEERALSLFQTFIVAALLPTFTSILGYIFGTKSSAQESNSTAGE